MDQESSFEDRTKPRDSRICTRAIEVMVVQEKVSRSTSEFNCDRIWTATTQAFVEDLPIQASVQLSSTTSCRQDRTIEQATE